MGWTTNLSTGEWTPDFERTINSTKNPRSSHRKALAFEEVFVGKERNYFP